MYDCSIFIILSSSCDSPRRMPSHTNDYLNPTFFQWKTSQSYEEVEEFNSSLFQDTELHFLLYSQQASATKT